MRKTGIILLAMLVSSILYAKPEVTWPPKGKVMVKGCETLDMGWVLATDALKDAGITVDSKICIDKKLHVRTTTVDAKSDPGFVLTIEQYILVEILGKDERGRYKIDLKLLASRVVSKEPKATSH